MILVDAENVNDQGALTMSTVTPTQFSPTSAASVPEPVPPLSDLIDPSETLYRLTVEEYEQIAGLLDDDRVELIDGFMVKKMTKNPPHVVACRRVDAMVERTLRPAGTPGRATHYGSRVARNQSPTSSWCEERSTITRSAIPNRPTSP